MSSLDALHATACTVCLADDDQFSGFNIDAEQLLWDVYHNKLVDGVHKITARSVAQKLWEAVEKGYGKSPVEVEWDSPDMDMLKGLSKNIYQFAAAKDWNCNKQLTELIVQDGKAIGYGKFRAMAAPIVKTFHKDWMRAEYNHAIAQSQMSSKWVDIEANQEALPLLKYQTVGDQRVRVSHAEIDQVLKPIDDDFWKTYYPPNGWNCRCTVTQESGGNVDKKEYPSDGIADPLFSKNWGAEGVVFPPAHPYFQIAPGIVLASLSKEDLSNVAFHRIGEITEKGGSIWRNALVDENASDYIEILIKAREWAQLGDRVQIMPRIDSPKKSEIYPIIYKGIPEKYYGKCPDYRRNEEWWEHEGYEDGKFNLNRSVRRMISKGYKQAPNVVITFPNDMEDDVIRTRISEYGGNHEKIEYMKKPE